MWANGQRWKGEKPIQYSVSGLMLRATGAQSHRELWQTVEDVLQSSLEDETFICRLWSPSGWRIAWEVNPLHFWHARVCSWKMAEPWAYIWSLHQPPCYYLHFPEEESSLPEKSNLPRMSQPQIQVCLTADAALLRANIRNLACFNRTVETHTVKPCLGNIKK